MLERVFRRKALEDQSRRQGRLPPGQSLTQKFPVLHYGPVPVFNPSTWDFRIWGEIEEDKKWTWEELNQLPHTRLTLDIHCVTRWSKLDTTWEGISVRQLVQLGWVKPKSSARYVLQHAEYGFTVNLPLDVVLAENFLLATHYDGQPLTPEHGAPLRGVVGYIPGREDLKTPYFWKGAKWLRGLEFMANDRRGFWEQAGYHNEADVWNEERFG
jgi:DMSO/TMAO reductase YedYZ molybdopterin-dependent catalytic subunit